MSDESMSVKEAAEYLGFNVRTVYVLAGAKKIAHARIGPNGGKIRFSRADLDAYVASCRVEVAGAKVPSARKAKAEEGQLIQGKDHFGLRAKANRSDHGNQRAKMLVDIHTNLMWYPGWINAFSL